MKKMMTRLLAVALAVVMACSLIPTAFAAQTYSLKKTSFDMTVGLGTSFQYIGLPTVVGIEEYVTASITWNQGNYDGNKEGTYHLTGTARPNGDFSLASTAVTATVTVVDVGFSLTLPTYIQTRNRYARTGLKADGTPRVTNGKLISVVRHLPEGNFNDYDWNYRWYITYDLNDPGTYYGDTKDVKFFYASDLDYYLYCKVSMTKDGVTRTLTSNPLFMETQGNNLFRYDYTHSVEEIVPGEPFDLSITINITNFDGTVDEKYASGLFPQTYVFSSSVPGVTFSPRTYETLVGPATTTVTVPEDYAGSTVDFNVHITGDISKTWFNEMPPFDVDVPYTMPIAGRGGAIESAKNAVSLSKYFTDVDAAWAAPAVDSMKDGGYMNGTSAKTFSPNASMSRGMLVTTLYRMAGSPAVTDAAQSFADVSSADYYANAVAWASANGIVNGIGDGRFAPNQRISRQDLAAVLYRYAGMPAAGELTGYSDAANVAAYASAPMAWATSAGIIKGTSGALNPSGDATRAQVAVMLFRFLSK